MQHICNNSANLSLFAKILYILCFYDIHRKMIIFVLTLVITIIIPHNQDIIVVINNHFKMIDQLFHFLWWHMVRLCILNDNIEGQLDILVVNSHLSSFLCAINE